METLPTSLQTLKTEETKVQSYIKTGVSTITVTNCINGTALVCNPCRKDYNILIGKSISKMFQLHGKSFTPDMILLFLESITETYKYETPQTIILFLNKAAKGDFGKFYGDPDIGTLREWFADFLQKTIIPERESQKRYNAIGSNDRGQERSLREYIEGSNKVGPVNIPGKFKGLSKS